MEISQKDLELFMQFKQFMNGNDNNINSNNNKRKRRKKGTGSITKLSGSRERPYMATWTTGYNDNDEGQQMQVPLAYFKLYEHADKALDLYMLEKDGKCAVGTVSEYVYNVDGKLSKNNTLISQDARTTRFNGKDEELKDCPTFAEIWKIVLNSELTSASYNTLKVYNTAFNNLRSLHDKKINEIFYKDLQNIFDKLMEEGTGNSKMGTMKVVTTYVFKYAIKCDYVEKNYAQYIKFKETLTSDEKKNKVPYTKELIKELFKHDDDIIVQSILVMIYTGMRPTEVLKLKKENIFLDDRYMIGGIKTKNGIDRIIPIHECIVPYIENVANNLNMIYRIYLTRYNKVKKMLKFECTPHSGRHTFASLSNEYELNEFLIKKIMGHSAKDLTKDVYTHVDTQRLIKEINKIPTFK